MQINITPITSKDHDRKCGATVSIIQDDPCGKPAAYEITKRTDDEIVRGYVCAEDAEDVLTSWVQGYFRKD